MKFSQLVLRFFLYSFVSFMFSVIMVFIYGQHDQFAGYLLFYVPISGAISGFLLTALQAFRPKWHILVMLLLAIPFSIIGFFILMFVVFNAEVFFGRKF